jgi:hypothetical protein
MEQLEIGVVQSFILTYIEHFLHLSCFLTVGTPLVPVKIETKHFLLVDHCNALCVQCWNLLIKSMR